MITPDQKYCMWLSTEIGEHFIISLLLQRLALWINAATFGALPVVNQLGFSTGVYAASILVIVSTNYNFVSQQRATKFRKRSLWCTLSWTDNFHIPGALWGRGSHPLGCQMRVATPPCPAQLKYPHNQQRVPSLLFPCLLCFHVDTSTFRKNLSPQKMQKAIKTMPHPKFSAFIHITA